MDNSKMSGRYRTEVDLLMDNMSREKLEVILDNIPSSIVIVNADGKFEYVNKRGMQIYGINYIGYDLDTHVLQVKAKKPDGRPFPLEEMPVNSSLIFGQTISDVEMIIENINGKRYSVNASSAPLYNNKGKILGAIVIFEEFNERKKVQEEMERFNKDLEIQRGSHQTVIDSMPVGIWISDSTGKTTFINDIARRIYGGKAPYVENIREYNVYQAWWPETGEKILAEDMPMARALKGETLKEVSVDFLRFDGTRGTQLVSAAPIKESNGDILGCVALVRDITEIRIAEKELRQREERFGALVAASSNIVYRMSSDWKEMRQLQGRKLLTDSEDLNPNWLQDYIPLEEQPLVMSTVKEAIRTKSIFELEHRVFQADRSIGWTLSRAIPLLDDKGEIYEWFGAASDITQRIKAEEALRESEERQAFLLKLSDALRPLANPKEIQAISVRLLGENIAANHVHYAEVVGDYVIVHHAYGNGLPPMIGRFRYMDFGERLIATYRAGKTGVCYDVDLDPTITKDEAAVLRGSGIRAYVAVPLVKHGEWVSVLGVDSMEPREWTADEVKLVEEVAERTWAAVERARAEEKLRESEAKLRGIMEQLPVGVSHYNLDGQILLSNSYYSSLIPEKMPSRDLERMNYWSAMDDEGHALHPDQWPGAKSLRGETVMPGIEFSYADLSGQKKWFLVSASPFRSNEGEVIGGIAVTEDITERKRAEEALQESKKKYHTLFDSIDEGFCIIEVLFGDYDRPLDYLVCEVNQAFQRQTGLVDAVGRWMRDLAPDHEQHWFDIYGRIALTGESARFQNPADALGRFYDVYAFRIGEPNQRRVAVIFNDISARKRIEETLKESEKEAKELVEKLEEADKNKNKFIGVLSHELRNPLAAIVAGLSLLEISEDKQQRERAQGIINRQIKQLCKLVDDLLDLTRITQNKIFLKKETVELNELVNKSVQDYQSQFIEKNVRLEVKLTSPLYLEADPSRLTQVIGNLLHNAAKFTSKSDLVRVTVSQDKNTREAVITVEDTGRGIAPEVLETLFESFIQVDESLDRSQGGLGLGLVIVKGIVELHGGKVEVFSEGIDQGTKFTIRLLLPKENMGE